MSLIEQIELLGARVEAGDLEFGDAVQALVEWADGGLTQTGAREWLKDWRGSRGFLEALAASIPPAIEALEAVAEATSSEERTGARAAADQAIARLRDVAASTDGEPKFGSDGPTGP